MALPPFSPVGVKQGVTVFGAVIIETPTAAPAEGPAVIVTFDGAPVDGASGTYAGQAGRGSILMRTDATPKLYQNTGTLAAPTWTAQT